jgi:hypothetical protein
VDAIELSLIIEESESLTSFLFLSQGYRTNL